MDVVSYVLEEIEFRIPIQVLNHTLVGEGIRSWQEGLKEIILMKRVIPNTNIFGYNIDHIATSAGCVSHYDNNVYSYHYTMDQLGQKEIIAVNGLFSLSGMGGVYSGGVSSNSGTLLGALEGNTSVAPIMNMNTLLLGKNTIGIYTTVPPPTDAVFRIQVAEIPDLNSIQPKAIALFTDLVEKAVKSYVYLNRKSAIGLRNVYGGLDHDAYDDIVSDYSGAEEEYKELLDTKWGKVSIINSLSEHSQLIFAQIPNTSF